MIATEDGVQQVLVVFGLILGGGLVMVFRFLRPEQLVNEIGMSQLLGYIQSNRIPTAAFLPSTSPLQIQTFTPITPYVVLASAVP